MEISASREGIENRKMKKDNEMRDIRISSGKRAGRIRIAPERELERRARRIMKDRICKK